MFAKTLQKRVSAHVCVFCCSNRRNNKETDNWKFWIWAFCPRMAVLWLSTVFQKLVCWYPCFYSVLGRRAFWAKLSKQEILEPPPKNRKRLTENWIAHFWVFLVFLVVVIFGGFLEGLRVFGPPHLALNTPYCVLGLLFFWFFWGGVVFWGGGLILFYFLVFFFPFCFLKQKTCFSP